MAVKYGKFELPSKIKVDEHRRKHHIYTLHRRAF